ncbi:sensor histidine kinase [Nitriliruptor alkaliphilus]|uniref:sensor histidine kinase n=1 Tax=Nitriliruptor alkaliphilus TaxID=427918 RepID=UPI000698E722|nr:histidine kinase [Nitriliruptor alkaliphilus]
MTRPERIVWSWSTASVALVFAAAWLSWSTRHVVLPAGFEAGPGAAYLVATLAFVASGAVLAARRPANLVGWVLLAMGTTWQLYGLAGVLRVVAHDAGRAAPWAAWAWDTAWIPALGLVPVLVLCFPDGRLPAPRWRRAIVLLSLSMVALLAGIGLRPGRLASTPVDNPLGLAALADATPVLETVGNLCFAAALLAAAVSMWVRYRRALRTERYQLKWFVTAVVLVVAGATAGNVLEATGASAETLALVRTAPLLALPIAVTVAVLRYRLYGIDTLISRSLQYTGLAGVVGLVYLTVVIGIGSLVGGRPNTGVPLTVGATAIAAVVFQPARRRLEEAANRLVYGQRASPYDVLSSFTERMAGVYPTGTAPEAMAEAVVAGLPVADCCVWLRVRDDLRLAASWPPGADVGAVRIDPSVLRLPGSDHVYPVHRDGTLLGAIAVTSAPGEQLSAAEDRLLRDLAAAAWLVLDNAQLVSELRTSRERLVTAQDAQRRRTERDLHDGAQQRLLELALTLRTAHRQVDEHGPLPATDTIAAAEMQLRAALAELRDLARGIHPAILTERGLVAALESLAARAPLPVTVSAEAIGRLSPTVESTAYFVAAEAIANVIKHAGAGHATIDLHRTGDLIRLQVSDDGSGGADPTQPGLTGLADRVGALDGSLEIVSPPAGGTRLTAILPCA